MPVCFVRSICAIPLAVCAALAFAADRPAVVIAVEASGADSANGDAATGPVKSLSRAQALARSHLAAMAGGSEPRRPIRVLIGPGEYPLTATLTFGPQDSGTAAAPVSYEAKQAGTALISGGTELGSKTAAKPGTAISYSAPSDTSAVAGGSQLYVNGRRATLARQPNAGDNWFIQRAVRLPSEAEARQGSEAFSVAPSNIAWINGLSAADKKRAIVDVYHAWTVHKYRFSNQPSPAGSVRVAPRSRWPFLSQGGGSQRFFIENVAAALDAPGEWIQDDGEIRYIPRNDEAGGTLKAVLPQLEKIIVVQGERDRPVSHLRFDGLAFAHSRYVLPAEGFADEQGATAVSAAIELSHTRDVTLEDCNVSKTGGWGIWLKDGARETTIRHCTLSDLGAGAIKVGREKQAPSDSSATGANEVTANTVDNTGKVFPQAPAIWVGQSWDNKLTRNTIHDTTYTGISVGWSWGYAEPTSGRNLINGNLLYNIGQRQLADLGGIYTLGRSPGTVISHNIVRAVRGYPDYGSGAWGIYADEGSSDLMVDGNVVVGTDTGGFRLHYGKNNQVKGNLFTQGNGKDEINVERVDPGTNLRVEQNTLAGPAASAPDGAKPSDEIRWSANSVQRRGDAKCGKHCDGPRVSANPVDIQTDGPEASIVSRAVAAWSGKDTPPSPTAKPLALASKPLAAVVDAPEARVAPAAMLNMSLADDAIDSRPGELTYEPKNQPAAIRVEKDPSAPDGKCLAFNDSETFERRYEPFAYATLTYDEGPTVVEFALKVGAAAVMVHEWRDGNKPYRTGPSLRIAENGVTVNGQVVAPVSLDQWTTYRITASSQNWKLEILGNGGRVIASRDNLPFRSADWRQLRWLGFIADAPVTARSCLARLTSQHRSK